MCRGLTRGFSRRLLLATQVTLIGFPSSQCCFLRHGLPENPHQNRAIALELERLSVRWPWNPDSPWSLRGRPRPLVVLYACRALPGRSWITIDSWLAVRGRACASPVPPAAPIPGALNVDIALLQRIGTVHARPGEARRRATCREHQPLRFPARPPGRARRRRRGTGARSFKLSAPAVGIQRYTSACRQEIQVSDRVLAERVEQRLARRRVDAMAAWLEMHAAKYNYIAHGDRTPTNRSATLLPRPGAAT